MSQIFADELKKSDDYKKKEYKTALKETFRRIDEMIESPEGQAELYKIRYGENANKNSEASGMER